MCSIVFAGIIGIFLLIIRKSLFQRMFYGFMSFIKAIRERVFIQFDGYKKKAAIRLPFTVRETPNPRTIRQVKKHHIFLLRFMLILLSYHQPFMILIFSFY